MTSAAAGAMTDGRPAKSILALVDSSPVLLLPSVLACRERFSERSLHVFLTGPVQFDAAMQRLVAVLARHGISAHVQERAETLEATLATWLNDAARDAKSPLLDVSSASGGTATRAVLALQRDGRPYELCWFVEANNEVHFSSGGAPDAHVIDIGSKRSVRSAVGPIDVMSVFGLERAIEDPYCGVPRQRLVPLARDLLRIAMKHADEYRQLRQVLGAARFGREVPIETVAIPEAARPLVQDLATFDGWLRTEGPHIVLCGACDTRGVFFLSGGWLEVLVAECIQRALPDHVVQANCGTSWGRKRRAEAEMDVAFVYHNALYLVSCKNEHLTERFFPHLDRFRALIAEFGESRTRPVLLSTTELETRHVRRCDAYEIGQISGRPLLDLIDTSLRDEPGALLKGLLTVSRGAPRAGLS
jgi:hypothetical protein